MIASLVLLASLMPLLQPISATAIIVPVVIAALAALIGIAIAGAWTFRYYMAMFAFALCVLLLPRLIGA